MDMQRDAKLIQEIDTLGGELKSYQSREAGWERAEQERQQIDFTVCKQSEETLQASEKRFRALIENSAEVISLVYGDGTLLYDSPSFSQLLGFCDEERKCQNALSLVHTEDMIYLLSLFREIVKKSSRVVIPATCVRHKDDSCRWIEGIVNNILTEPSIQAIIINFHDITECKRLEESLHARR
jgi:PAS domain S-box-containing protein